ncbi:MAG: MMPL family transporter, partial [Deltaproteobacteria bacterium]|nr:MMPL family transporter [Deltaproteobacteria bacterium]
ALEEAPHVEKVFSLTNIESVTSDGEWLKIEELVELPIAAEAVPALRKRALANELYVGNIVSEKGDFTCIIARLPHYRDDFDYKVEAVGAIREILAGEGSTRFFLSGGPTLDEQFFYLSERDSQVTTPAMIALLVVTLWFLLRSASNVALALGTVILATMWGVAWIVLSGSRINMLTTILPPLLLAVGVAGSMHVLVDYRDRCGRGEDKMTALRSVYRELMTPLFLTSLTTAIGMTSLMVSRIQGVREFGGFAALGVVGAFLLSVTLVPIVLSRFTISDDALAALHRLTMNRGGTIVMVSAVLLTAAIAAGTMVKAESSFLEYFRDSEPIKRDTKRIEQALAGTMTIDVVIDTGTPGGVKNPEVLAQIVALQDFLEADEHVTSTQSVADYLKDLRRAFFSNDQREYRLPDTTEEAAQYLLLYEMDAPDGDLYDMMTSDYQQARVTARLDITSSNIATALVNKTEEYIARNFPPELDVRVTGLGTLYANMEEYMRSSLVYGFSVALIAIYIIFCLQTGSLVLGTISMIPNVAPIVLCLGIMGLFGINLDAMTAMVASIAIGLAVDDSIHFVSRVRLHLANGIEMTRALERTTVEIGRALVFTTIALAVGFSVMMLSAFVGTIHFGLLCLLTIIFALAADLVLLPVVLHWYSERSGAHNSWAAVSPQRSPELGKTGA